MSDDRHYRETQSRADVNRSENTAWTQTIAARNKRAMAVSCMPQVLLQPFPDGTKRLGFSTATKSQQKAWRDIVSMLQQLGLLSPSTAAVDVDVPRIVLEAEQINARIRSQKAKLAHDTTISA